MNNSLSTCTEVFKMNIKLQDMRDRLNLFEGIVIGIYGNWLISLLDKITFSRILVLYGISFDYLQPLSLLLSFSTLLILFAYSIFAPHVVTRRFWAIVGVGHLVGNYGALWVEGYTLKFAFFYVVGLVLFTILYYFETVRIRMSEEQKA